MLRHPKVTSVRGPLMKRLLLVLLLGTLRVSEAGGGDVSNGHDLKTDKSKIQMLQAYAPAMKRDPDVEDKVDDILPVEGSCLVGSKFGSTCKVHPLIVAYMQETVPGSGSYDIHAAVSLDEGGTWKRKNLSNIKAGTLYYNGPRCFTVHDEDDGDHTEHGRFLQEDEGTPDSFP